jgi:hypothetical protein
MVILFEELLVAFNFNGWFVVVDEELTDVLINKENLENKDEIKRYTYFLLLVVEYC